VFNRPRRRPAVGGDWREAAVGLASIALSSTKARPVEHRRPRAHQKVHPTQLETG
jgi:hypothetical protein